MRERAGARCGLGCGWLVTSCSWWPSFHQLTGFLLVVTAFALTSPLVSCGGCSSLFLVCELSRWPFPQDNRLKSPSASSHMTGLCATPSVRLSSMQFVDPKSPCHHQSHRRALEEAVVEEEEKLSAQHSLQILLLQISSSFS